MFLSNVQEDLSVLIVYVSGYSLSAVLLLASIAIFCYFRSVLSTLRTTDNKLREKG